MENNRWAARIRFCNDIDKIYLFIDNYDDILSITALHLRHLLPEMR